MRPQARGSDNRLPQRNAAVVGREHLMGVDLEAGLLELPHRPLQKHPVLKAAAAEDRLPSPVCSRTAPVMATMALMIVR